MELYKGMCDGELLAFYRAAKVNADITGKINAEIAKMESEIRSRNMNPDDYKPVNKITPPVSTPSRRKGNCL